MEANASGRERGRQLVADIYKAYEADADERQSRRIGYSWIGGECERELYYKWRWVSPPKKFEGRMLRLFETGDLEEARFVSDLRRVGAEVWDRNPENASEQISAKELNGIQFGFLDSVCGNVPHATEDFLAVEYKTHSEKSFAKLEKEGVARAKPEHYAQMQGYMREKGMKEALYFAKNKNTDALYAEFVPFNELYAERLLDKAKRLIDAHSPPPRIHNDPGYFKCRMCDHAAVCYKGMQPLRNCRTCMFAAPSRDEIWTCGKDNGRELDSKAQEAGCERHRFLPGFIPMNQVDVRGDDVVYKDANGVEFIDNGKEVSKVEG